MERRLSEDRIKQMQDTFLGKRIRFKDQNGNVMIGTCEFIGYNLHIPSWGFQVTVDRTPFQNVNPDTVKLFEGRRVETI